MLQKAIKFCGDKLHVGDSSGPHSRLVLILLFTLYINSIARLTQYSVKTTESNEKHIQFVVYKRKCCRYGGPMKSKDSDWSQCAGGFARVYMCGE